MTGMGTIEAIHVAPAAEADVVGTEEAEAVTGRGLRGDRYFRSEGTVSGNDGSENGGRDRTLIEREAIDAIARESDVRLATGAHLR